MVDRVRTTLTYEQDGENHDERLVTLHKIMLMMLKDFASICEREGLVWFLAYGSAIGAVRHKGFIPWDDDLDICMPRADLNRLTELVTRGYSEKYRMINSTLDPYYPMATSRMMLNGTEFRDDALASMNFESGIFLDLFPLDNLPDDERQLKRQAWRAWVFNKLAIAKLVKVPYVAGGGILSKMLKGGAGIVRLLLNLPGFKRIDFNRHSLKIQTSCKSSETIRVGFLCETDRLAHIYRWDDLFPVKRVPFEDINAPLARCAEDILASFYGDYLTPPPLDQRNEHYPKVLEFGPYADIGK